VHLPGRTVLGITDKGVWGRHVIEVTLDGNEKVVFKMSEHEEPLPPGSLPKREEHEESVVRILRSHGIPAPRVLAVDSSRRVMKYPFIIQEHVGGTRLGTLLDQVGEVEAQVIYETVGRLYRRIHSIHAERSGIWLEDPQQVLRPGDEVEYTPNDFMYRAEILEGSGKQAVEQGRIPLSTYYRAVASWARNMDYLKDHQPSLVHMSPFPWTISLDREDGVWRVTKLMALDMCWWDPAFDLACLQYPPFRKANPVHWEAFLRGYGPAPERKRVLLYAVLERLMAAMGAFQEPPSPSNKAWARNCLKELDPFMKEIQRYD